MSELIDAIREQAPEAVDLILKMPLGSAYRQYSARYLAHRLTGCERPAASGWAIGVDHAAELRMLVEERLPESIRDLSRA
jgi:hypothetical protein